MPSLKSLLSYLVLPVIVIFAVIMLSNGLSLNYLSNAGDALTRLRPHGPDMALLARQSLVIKVHLFAALAAILLGASQFVLPKGTLRHRIMGWTWLIFMTVIAVSSLFIRQINHGNFSFIHIFSVLTLIQVPRIIWFARKGDIKNHRNAAIGLYIGALLVAGAFTFMPGRLMWQLFFG